jgi:hypothetical protein
VTEEERRSHNLELKRLWYQKNRERILLQKLQNRDHILAKRREYNAQNRDRLRQQHRERYWRDPERARRLSREYDRRTRHRKKPRTPEQKAAARERTRRYRQRHREKLHVREQERLATDPAYKFARLLRSRVGKAVKAQYAAKAFKTMDVVGCCLQKLFTHLEMQFKEGMEWHNYGRDGWHIDHIIPCAAFDLSQPDQQKKCFHYSNLRPAWARQNEGRASRIEGELQLIYRHKKQTSR